MLGWVVRILIVLAGFITSLFVAREALNFNIIQMVVAVCLFTALIAAIAFWPLLKTYFKFIFKKR